MFIRNKKIMILLMIIFIIIFMPIFGYFHKIYFGPSCTSFICPSHAEFIDGFFISYMFFVPLFLVIFGDKNKYKNLFILLGFVGLFDLLIGTIEILIIDFSFAFFGWLLAEILSKVIQKK